MTNHREKQTTAGLGGGWQGRIAEIHNPIDIVPKASELSTGGIVAQINHEHELFQQSIKSGLVHAVRCGQLLIEVKGFTEWGKWEKWVNKHCNFSVRHAQRYMQLASNATRVSHLPESTSLREALKLLSKTKSKSKPKSNKSPTSWINSDTFKSMQDSFETIEKGIRILINTESDPITAQYLLNVAETKLRNLMYFSRWKQRHLKEKW